MLERLKTLITWPIVAVLALFGAFFVALLYMAPAELRNEFLGWVLGIGANGLIGAYIASRMKPPPSGPSSADRGRSVVNPLLPLFLAVGVGAASMQGCGASSYDRHTIAVSGLQLTSQLAKTVVESKFAGTLTHGDMPPVVAQSLHSFDVAVAAYAMGVDRYADGQIGGDDVLPLALAAYQAFQALLDLLESAGVDTSQIPRFGAVQ